MSNLPVPASDGGSVPAILDRAGPGARFAAEEFFTAQLGNPHTQGDRREFHPRARARDGQPAACPGWTWFSVLDDPRLDRGVEVARIRAPIHPSTQPAMPPGPPARAASSAVVASPLLAFDDARRAGLRPHLAHPI